MLADELVLSSHNSANRRSGQVVDDWLKGGITGKENILQV